MSEESKYKLTDEEYTSILGNIMEISYDGISPSASLLVFVLGGQPGAGKSSSKGIIEQKILDSNYVTVDIDEYRQHHPQAKKIFEEHDKDYSIYTNPAVFKWGDEVQE